VSLHRCCNECDDSGCCQVGNDPPLWLNRYCFQMSGFHYLYRRCECRDPVDGCQPCPENQACSGCVECCREKELTLCAYGALFRSPKSLPLCQSTADSPEDIWNAQPTSICNSGAYVPPNIDSSVGGVTSFYTSPPCDCSLAQNDRLTWIGRTRNEDVNGCCGEDDYDEPINCVSGRATIECVEDACDTVGYPCCDLDPALTRTHYLTLTFDNAGWGSCSCPDTVPAIEFKFAAELGPRIGPHMATWRLIGVSGPYDCLYPTGFLPCTVPECCDPANPDACCVQDCTDFVCELCNPQVGRCTICHDLGYTFPTIQLFPYQNCTAPTC